MKKGFKLKAILIALLLIPFYMVSAKTKTEAFVDALTDLVQSIDATVNLEGTELEIAWNSTNSQYSETTFSYNGNIIEYNPGEITTYDEAEKYSASIMYSSYFVTAALEVNGYSKDEINEALSSEGFTFDYERNGIEYIELGEEKTFSDDSSTITITPHALKIDVTCANLTKEGDSEFEAKTTTVSDVVEHLNADESFSHVESEGQLLFEREVYMDDDSITLESINYWNEYYNVLFNLDESVLSYEVQNIDDFYDAESAFSHQSFAIQLIATALKLNGYTSEQIKTVLSQENKFDYERNGIEYKELGEVKKYVNPNDPGEFITIGPVSIRIDLERANLDGINSYKVLEGDSQTIDNDSELSFRLDIEYSKFQEDGKVYMDGKLVDKVNYTTKEGSTIIIFNKNYVKTLSTEEHTLKVTAAGGEVSTKFTVSNKPNTIKNPNTIDNIMVYVSLLLVSIISLIAFSFYKKREY